MNYYIDQYFHLLLDADGIIIFYYSCRMKKKMFEQFIKPLLFTLNKTENKQKRTVCWGPEVGPRLHFNTAFSDELFEN